MLAWGKGWIASQVLDARLIGPSWGLNQRRYDRNFRTSRLDFVAEDALARLAPHRFTESDYRATGLVDFGDALEMWARGRGLDRRGSYLVAVEGMWGGYAAIRRAREFLLAQLLNSRGALRNAFGAVRRDRTKLFVTVHMRAARDGFTAPGKDEDVRGRFNIFVPGEWYLWVCDALRSEFGERIQFYFLTDRRDEVFEEAVRRFNPGQLHQTGLTECSDLLLMTEADLRVCSVSSYSLAACFLSDGPYLWYEPQLTLRDGAYSLWGDEKDQQHSTSATGRSIAYLRGQESVEKVGESALGAAMKIGDLLPSGLVKQLWRRVESLDPRTNLLDYGAIPSEEHGAKLARAGSQYDPEVRV
jgi:hypothetical protein